MVVTQLLGGLGNQLFQYCMGRALAAKHGTSLKLDISAFDDYPLRPYVLGHFSLEATVLTQDERRRLGIGEAPKGPLARALRRVFGARGIPVVRERSFEYDAEAMNAPSECSLQGYWQSPRYFAAIESSIRSELTVRDPLRGENKAAADRITGSLAVSLHVRRGDYSSNPVTNRYHGTCGPEYYQAAEKLLREKVGGLNLFVFSDEPDWAEANLRFASPVTVFRHNGPEQDYEDLRLMTLCRHHIIANSTFSWWGAWLCPQPDKIVIAPKNWFRDARHRTDDLIPAGWIRI